MRKFTRLLLAVVLMLGGMYATAQDKTISGVVTDADDNAPVPGVSVTIKGTNRGTTTDTKGAFTIRVQKGEVLLISSVGYEGREMKVGDGATISVKIKNSQKQMGEVIVTAMDIKRNPRELGYSTQTVKGSDIQQTQRENFINSLQGRVAGLTVTPTGGTAGASASIVLRGFNTLSGTNQPLFIVDGILIDNQTLNQNSYGGSGVGLASDLPNRNSDYTNRIADINPNDIESVTVLKGPEATALYGSQASSGAIVITTKKANAAGKLIVNYDNNFRFQKVTRFVELDNRWGPGANGVPTAPPLSGQFTSFGPAWPSDTKLYDNIHHFFRTGFTQTHNIGVDFGTKKSGFRFSGTYLDNDGTVPFNTYKKYNLKLSNNTKIGKFITINPTIAYVNSDNVKPIKGANGYLMDLYSWPANNDITNYQDKQGNKLLLFNSNYNVDYDNPIWSAKNNKSGDKNSRWIATMGIDITPFEWLTLSGRFGYDTYKQDGYLFTHPMSYLLSASTGGSLDNYYRTYEGYNHTITASAKKKFGDFSTRLMVGTMWEDFETRAYGVTGSRLKDSTSTDSSNTTESTRTRLLQNYFGKPNRNILRELAYFTEASIGWKDLIYLTASYRFENASPLPNKNNKYSYPGASMSMILSDIFPKIKGKVLDFAKLRASLASTARLNDPYSNQSYFVNNYSSTVLNPTYTYGYIKANPDLEPERQKTYEIGTELRFLNNAITLEAAYYNTLCTNQIVQQFRASYATGAVLNTGNAGSLRNQGVELSLNITPIRKSDFNWNVSFNFNHMWSKVLTLPDAIGKDNDFYQSDNLFSARGGLVRGHQTGTITGSTYVRNNKGQIVVSPNNGVPEIDANFKIIGDRTPDFTLGTLNSFRYKNWNFSFLWDLKVGGDIYNLADQVQTVLGKTKRTSDRTTPRVVNGVLDDGLQNTDNPTPNNIVVVPYYLNTYYTMPNEEYISHNVNWLKLRDVTLSYLLPEKVSHVIKGMKSLSVFVTGNDLVLFTNYEGADPSVIANNPGSVGVGSYGFDYGSPATPVSVSFGLRARF
ncbi:MULTISPECIES: SusC/RagA family TonB-linked outer membrane protein [Niastella]|uniref:SusC/RagA family TonB-linked outer membrane protein n=1 Tax=Niastella soli TaxID=2821487 RepID=A0ABS3YZ38_9BACT|nr:SusC/RagA family TonB-linked outer membrane protein [Niastella soli]MBO9203183.1 SusC/RagA family TonB-linked outer membrane protein [Niastella soli]